MHKDLDSVMLLPASWYEPLNSNDNMQGLGLNHGNHNATVTEQWHLIYRHFNYHTNVHASYWEIIIGINIWGGTRGIASLTVLLVAMPPIKLYGAYLHQNMHVIQINFLRATPHTILPWDGRPLSRPHPPQRSDTITSKVKVSRSPDASDKCWPISREQNGLETLNLVHRLSSVHPRVTKVTRYCNALLFGVTSPVTRYYLPEVTLQVTTYFLQ